MIDKKALKEKYQGLPSQEKVIVGEALVKVNLGVNSPTEQRIVAGFLKGSEFIAKAGQLDALVEYLHQDESVEKLSSARDRTEKVPPSLVKKVVTYSEDREITEKSAGTSEKNRSK